MKTGKTLSHLFGLYFSCTILTWLYKFFRRYVLNSLVMIDLWRTLDCVAHISGLPSSVDPLFHNCQLTWTLLVRQSVYIEMNSCNIFSLILALNQSTSLHSTVPLTSADVPTPFIVLSNDSDMTPWLWNYESSSIPGCCLAIWLSKSLL